MHMIVYNDGETILREKGVDLHLDQTISHVRRLAAEDGASGAGPLEVTFSTGETGVFDCIAVAHGMRSNMEFVKEGQLEIDRALVVDEFMRTSDPDVYAAGDSTTALIAQDVLVLASSVGDSGLLVSSDSGWITLAVDPAKVQEIIAASSKASLHFVIPGAQVEGGPTVAGGEAEEAIPTSQPAQEGSNAATHDSTALSDVSTESLESSAAITGEEGEGR